MQHTPTNHHPSIKRYIVIDSRDRDYAKHPSASSYVIDLPETFYNVTTARLMTAEIPTSFYIFSAARNNTSITVTYNNTLHTVTIPDGNYGFTAIAEALKAALTTAFGVAVTVTIDFTTMKTTITSSVPTDVLGVDTTSLSSNAKTQWGLAYYLGFDRDLLQVGTGSITSPRVASMNPELYVLLDIDELGTIRECGVEGGGGTMGRTTFAKIPLTVESNEYNMFDKQLTCNTFLPPLSKLSKVHIAFRFHDGTPLEFHGVEHALTIEVECALGRSNHALRAVK
jgi:hypothetical protein